MKIWSWEVKGLICKVCGYNNHGLPCCRCGSYEAKLCRIIKSFHIGGKKINSFNDRWFRIRVQILPATLQGHRCYIELCNDFLKYRNKFLDSKTNGLVCLTDSYYDVCRALLKQLRKMAPKKEDK